jgi:hypothetical protein
MLRGQTIDMKRTAVKESTSCCIREYRKIARRKGSSWCYPSTFLIELVRVWCVLIRKQNNKVKANVTSFNDWAKQILSSKEWLLPWTWLYRISMHRLVSRFDKFASAAAVLE